MKANAIPGPPRLAWWALGLALLAQPQTAPLQAQSGGTFVIKSNTIDAGGARSSGSTFVVTGTVGQYDAEPLQPSVGGTFGVTGGFWAGVVASPPPGDEIFSNGFEGT